MTKLKRYFFQVILWLVVWAILWFIGGADTIFLETNGPAFLFQAVLLAVLIFYAIPKFLFEKKYVLFVMLSILAIASCAYISSEIGSPGPDQRPSDASFEMNAPPPAKRPAGAEPQMEPPQRRTGRPPVTDMNGPRSRRQGPTLFFIHFLMMAISCVLATFLETLLFAQQKEREVFRNRNETLQTELKLLKSQINPHFLFNSLNNIYALSVIDTDKTQQSISHLSDMLRYVLYECDQEWVPLSKELTYIENYIKLHALKSSVPYPITTDFDIQDASIKVAPMLFIPFMENALKHSNIEKRKGAFIRIKILTTKSEIQFEIENSIPQQAVHKDDVGGIGLENVKRRLALLYPQKHELKIDNDGTTFKVTLKMMVHGQS